MLVEVLISLLIFSVVMLGAGFTLMKTQHYHEDAAQKTQQYFKSQTNCDDQNIK